MNTYADAPNIIAYQGKLTDNNGNPLTGSYGMTLRLYTQASGGSAIYTEDRSASNQVAVENGVFLIHIGTVTSIPLSVFQNKTDLYLGIEVPPDAEMTPRERLLSAPFALSVASNSVGTAEIANSTITFQDWASNGCGANQIPKFVGGVWSCADDETGSFANPMTTKLNFNASGADLGTTTGPGIEVDTHVFVTQGKVGLGTTDPISKLHISDVNDQLIVEDSDATADNRKWVIKSDGGNFYLLTANDSWSAWSSALQASRTGVGINSVLFPNGSVGIGAASPQTKLDVEGDAQFGSGTTKSTFSATGGLTMASNANLVFNGSGSIIAASSGSFTTTAGYGLRVSSSAYLGVSGGLVGIGTASPASILSIRSKSPAITLTDSLTSQAYQIRNGGAGSTTLDFYDSTAGKSRLFIASDGEVRIGTTTNVTGNSSKVFIFGGSNGANVDIMGDGNIVGGDQAVMELEGSDYATVVNSFAMQYYGPNGLGTTMGFANQKLGTLTWSGASTALIYTSNSIPIIFGTDYTERMRIGAGGDVQFGTGAIKSTFTATGNLWVAVGIQASSASFTTTGDAGIRVSSSAFLATSGGNVGIGTSAPESKLHVPDGSYAQFQDNNAGAPPAGDCDNDAERGRLSIDTANDRLYICNGASRGWDYIPLTD